MSEERTDPGNDARQTIRRFKLKEALSGSGAAIAYVVIYKNGVKTDTTREFNVYNGAVSFSGAIGDYGYAVFMADRSVWEVIQLEC